MNEFQKTCAVALLILAACSPEQEPAADSAAQEVPTPSPTSAIFGRDVVSTALPEFACSFSADGGTVYFNRASEDRSQLTMMSARYQDGSWTAAEPLPFSGEFRDVDPFVVPDGSRLYFSSDRPTPLESEGFDTWWVDLQEGGWSAPVHAGSPLNTEATEVFVSISSDGTLFFGSDRDGTARIYSSPLEDGEYRRVEVVPFDLNLAAGAGNPLISADGGRLLFVPEQEGSVGASDLYVTFQREDGWSPAQPLRPPANSAYADFAPGLSPDGQTLFFTSERPGVVGDFPEGERRPGDLFQVPLADVLP